MPTNPILFMDVKGYSRLSTGQQLQYYREVLPEISTRLDSAECMFQNTWGDAIVAVFPRVSQAVDCGLAIVDVVRQKGTPALFGESLSARIAIHMQEHETEPNVVIGRSDVVGVGVNYVARMEAAGIPGRVLVGAAAVGAYHEWHDANIAFSQPFERQLPKGAGTVPVRIADRATTDEERSALNGYDVSAFDAHRSSDTNFTLERLDELSKSKQAHDLLHALLGSCQSCLDDLHAARYRQVLMIWRTRMKEECSELSNLVQNPTLEKAVVDMQSIEAELEQPEENAISTHDRFQELEYSLKEGMVQVNKRIRGYIEGIETWMATC